MIEDIKKAVALLFQPGWLVEIRGVRRTGGMASMYFTDLDKMVRVLAKNDASEEFTAIWYTLQRLKPGINLTKDPGKATVREDIATYEWLVIDIDRPKMPKGTKKENATDDELKMLARCKNRVRAWLRDLGWAEPIVMCSGNGFHLLYKLPSWAPTEYFPVLKDTLRGIAYHFRDITGDAKDGKQCNIDESLSEPEQIIKAYGTWSRISDFPDHDTPWRESSIISVPDKIVPLTLSNLLEAQMELPTTSAGKSSSTSNGRPYNPEWYEDHGVGDLFDWASPYLAEGETFEENGETYYPSLNCPIHADDEGFYEHSGGAAHRHYAIIVNEKEQTIRNNCFSGELSLGQVIRKINAIKEANGEERYAHRVFKDKAPEDEAEDFGAELVDDPVTAQEPAPELKQDKFPPITDGGVCDNPKCKNGLYRVGASKWCNDCANPPEPEIVLPEEPAESEPTPELKGFDLVHTITKTGSSGLRVLRISDSPDRPVDWLWPDRIPAGGPFTFSGPIGCNKSMALLDIAARISKGDNWPDGSKNEFGPREVLICATEDELQTVIRPRLRACNANLENCLYLDNAFDVDTAGKRKSRAMDLEKDTQRLYEALSSEDGKKILLVILDPVTGFYGNADPNDNRKIRQMITKVSKMCMKTGVAVACIVHENKRKDANVVDQMMGASSMSQIIRSGMRFSFDSKAKPNGRIMASLKNSYGTRGGGMRFKVEQTNMLATDGRELKNIGFVHWGDSHNDSADDIRNQELAEKEEGGEDKKIDMAVGIFQKELADGRRLHSDVHRVLDKAGIGDETRRRARRRAGVVSSKKAPWYWWLQGLEHEPNDAANGEAL